MVTCSGLLWRLVRARGRPRPPSPAERDGLDTPASRGICCDGRGSFAASAWTPGLAWRTSSEPREVMYLGTRRSAPSATGGDSPFCRGVRENEIATGSRYTDPGDGGAERGLYDETSSAFTEPETSRNSGDGSWSRPCLEPTSA